jgi:hypothetical protein
MSHKRKARKHTFIRDGAATRAHRKSAKQRRFARSPYAPCIECGKNGRPVLGAELFPEQPELAKRVYYLCECGAWVAAIKKGNHPAGYPAGPKTRLARKNAHEIADAIWKSGFMVDVSAVYEWLSVEMGITRLRCTIGRMNAEQANRVTRLCTDYLNQKRKDAEATHAAKAQETAQAERKSNEAFKRSPSTFLTETFAISSDQEALRQSSGDGVSSMSPSGNASPRDSLCGSDRPCASPGSSRGSALPGSSSNPARSAR